MKACFNIRIERSQCIRHRYNKSACTRCMDACRYGAISFSNGLLINQEACTECMVCVSACPSEALVVDGYKPERTLADLGKAEKPVLSCSCKDAIQAHAHGPCLGYLSMELALALPVLLGKPVQLNMTRCPSCDNGHIVQRLVKMLAGLDGIEAVLSLDVLCYEDIRASRRDFFRMLRGGSVRAISDFSHYSGNDHAQSSYSKKSIPARRRLLNSAYAKCSNADKLRLGSSYAGVTVKDSCNGCMACVAMCPTGALSKQDKFPASDSDACTGCGLCEEFCPLGSISISCIFGTGADAKRELEEVSLT